MNNVIKRFREEYHFTDLAYFYKGKKDSLDSHNVSGGAIIHRLNYFYHKPEEMQSALEAFLTKEVERAREETIKEWETAIAYSELTELSLSKEVMENYLKMSKSKSQLKVKE